MNIVILGSHYDDIELAAGGSMAKWKAMGYNTYGIVVTRSDYEDRDYDTAKAEGKMAADILGYDLVTLEQPTRGIVYGRELIQLIDSTLTGLGADIVITHWEHDVHQDHAAVGAATITAARHLPKLLMYRSNWYHSSRPWAPNYYVDISNYIGTKEEAIKAHHSEYSKNGEPWLQFQMAQCAAAGAIFHVDYAEQFQLVKWME